MSVRTTHIMIDIQDCFYALYSALISATSPWTDWQIVRGWPDSSVFENLTKPFIYLLEPFKTGSTGQQGGREKFLWEAIHGLWVDRDVGGHEEIQIMESRLLDFFGYQYNCHRQTLTVTLGATTYTSKTLLEMGIRVTGVSGPRDVGEDDLKEFRREMTIEFIA